jgi:hypothetical protein
MTLRAMLRENQRQSNQSYSTHSTRNVGRDRYSHLHLIRRDGRGGLFLPCDARVVEPMTTSPTRPVSQISQKGGAA